MKIISKLLTLIAIFFILSCDPQPRDIFNDQYIKVKADINNTSGIISLGDTIKISLKLPDTVSNGTTNYVINSLQKGDFALGFSKIDTINKKSNLILSNTNSFWVTKGSLINSLGYTLTTTSKPYETVINFKPQEKGIYYIEVISQAGDFNINNNYSARLFVGFNTTNPHLELVSNFVGLTWLNGVNNQITSGFGAYAFRVN